jgi:hypothetical protein
MVDLTDPGGNFPVQDGIVVKPSPGVPVGYDLTQVLSDSMRSRPPWIAMATAMSGVFFNQVEQQRLALEMSRDHKVLGRQLKITTLKMMGLELNSDFVSDDAYDRLLSTVSVYLSAHGSNDFVAYIGYCLGFAMEMNTLWTHDYLSFLPGPGTNPSLFDYPYGEAPPDSAGIWYPTSHVALLYEEFAPNAPNANDITEFEDIFYRIAPIHLVLAYIGTVVTGYIGPLYMGVQQFEVSIDEAIAELAPTGLLYYQSQTYERSVDFATCAPLYPNRTIPGGFAVIPVDTGIDGAIALPNGVYWKPTITLINSGLGINSGYDVPSTNPINNAWTLTYSQDGNINWGMFQESNYGVLIEKTLTLLLNSSGDPSSSSWVQSGIILTDTFTRYDTNQGYTVSTIYAGGSVTSANPPAGTDCVVLTFRPKNTTNVVFTRGVDSVSIDIASMTISVTTGVVSSGIYPIGSGFYVAWAVMTGDVVSVYPGGITGSGAIDWLDFQIIQGALFPSPIPSSNPIPDASDRGLGPFWNVSSTVAELINQGAIDFGGLYEEVEQEFDVGRLIDASIAVVDLGVVPTTIIDQLIETVAVDLGSLVVSQTSSLDNFLNIGTTGTLNLGSVTDNTITQAYGLGSVDDPDLTAPVLFLGYVFSIITTQVSQLFYEITLANVITLGSLLPYVASTSDLGDLSNDLTSEMDLGGLLDALFPDTTVPTFQYEGYTSWQVNLIQDLGQIIDDYTDYVDLGTFAGLLPSFDCGYLDQAPSNDTVVNFPLSANIEFLDLDLGSIADYTIYTIDLGSLNAAFIDEFLFRGGVAIIEGISLVAINPQSQVIDGTAISLATQPFLQPFGIFEIELVSPYNEWHSVSSQEIFRLVDFGTRGLFVNITPSGVEAVLYGATTLLPITESIIRIGIIWSPTDTLFFVNGRMVDLGAEIVNLSTALMFGGNPTTETWLIQRIIALGGSDASQLPGISIMQTLTGGTIYQIANKPKVDLGPIFGTGSGSYINGDLGGFQTSITGSIDLGVAA